MSPPQISAYQVPGKEILLAGDRTDLRPRQSTLAISQLCFPLGWLDAAAERFKDFSEGCSKLLPGPGFTSRSAKLSKSSMVISLILQATSANSHQSSILQRLEKIHRNPIFLVNNPSASSELQSSPLSQSASTW